MFSYYKRDALTKNGSRIDENFSGRQLRVIKEIFLSFVMKLTPARRLFYGIAFLLFLFALLAANWTYALLAFVVLNLLLAFELADKMLAKDELEIAREIQLDLQPREDALIEGLEIASFYHPAKEVGGDYYDFIKINDHKVAIILGDVSGKGMPAALYAVKFQGLMELLVKKSHSLKDALGGINEAILHRLKKRYFITTVVAVFDLENKCVSLARAGHNPPLFYKSRTKELVWLKPSGIGIGLEPNPNFVDKLNEKTIPITKGDLFLFYTDGVTEAMNGAKVEFGERRLGSVVAQNAHLDAVAIKDKLVTDLNGFVQRALLDDDATMVVVKVKTWS